MSKKNNPSRIIIYINVMLMVILAQMGIDVYLPAFPAMQVELSTNPSLIQATITVYLASFGIGQLFISPFSDQFGRKPLMRLGIVLFTIGTVASGLSQTIGLLLLSRTLQGLGASIFSGVGRSISRDVFTGKELAQVFSLLSTAWATVPSIAPVLGGYILNLGHWANIFYFLAVLSFAGLGVAQYYLPETNLDLEKINLRTFKKDCLKIIKHKAMFTNVVVCLSLYNILIAVNMVGPFIFQVVLGLTPVKYAWTIFFMCMGYFFGVLSNRALLNYFEIRTLQKLGLIGCYLSTLTGLLGSYFYQVNFYAIVLPIFCLQWMIGFIYPNAVANALSSFTKKIGLVSSVFGFAMYTGSTVMSIALVVLPDNTQNPLLLFILFQLIITSIMIKLSSTE